MRRRRPHRPEPPAREPKHRGRGGHEPEDDARGGRQPEDRAAPSFAHRVYDLVRRIPKGHVISYGGVAALLGRPRAARGVGRALRELPPDNDVPWWRVVNHAGGISLGKLDPHAARLQRVLLEAEGVRFDRRGRIDWESYGWGGEAD